MQGAAKDGLLVLDQKCFDVVHHDSAHLEAAIELFLEVRGRNSIRASSKLHDTFRESFSTVHGYDQSERSLSPNSSGFDCFSRFGDRQERQDTGAREVDVFDT